MVLPSLSCRVIVIHRRLGLVCRPVSLWVPQLLHQSTPWRCLYSCFSFSAVVVDYFMNPHEDAPLKSIGRSLVSSFALLVAPSLLRLRCRPSPLPRPPALLLELGYPQDGPTPLYADNQAAIAMINEDKPTSRSRHIKIQHYAILGWHKNADIVMHYIPTTINPADASTKALSWTLFSRHVRRAMGHYGSPE